MVLIIVISILLVVLIFILFSPIRIILDTEREIYQLVWIGIAKAKLLTTIPKLGIDLSIFFWHKRIPLSFSSSKKKKKVKSKKKKTRFSLSFIKKIMRSFRIKQIELDVDTDDVITNAYLFPVFALLNKDGRKMNINYSGDLRMKLIVENSGFRIIRALIF